MFNRNAFIGIFFISLLVVVTSWYAAKMSIIIPFSDATLTQRGTMQNGVVVQMNDQGQLQYRGTVAQARENGSTDIALSDLKLVDYASGVPWTLTAASGMLSDHNNMLELGGGVSLSRPAEAHNPAIVVQTDQAKIDLQTQVITGHDLITVSQPGTSNLVQGIGFKAQIPSRQVQLLSGVKSVYQAAIR